MRLGRSAGLAAVAAIAALGAAPVHPAGAATAVLGPPDLSSFTPPSMSTDCFEFMLSGSQESEFIALTPGDPTTILVAPADGTLTSWEAAENSLAFEGTVSTAVQIARPAGAGTYLAAGDSPAFTSASMGLIGPVAANLPVRAGDRVALVLNCSSSSNMSLVGMGISRRPATAATNGFAVLSPTIPRALVADTNDAGKELAYNATVALDAPTVSAVTPSTGDAAGGQTVTITGQHLAVATAVTFGGTPATVVSADDNQITVTVPPGAAGPAPVSVTTAGGTNAAATYIYVATPVPSAPPPPRPPDTTAPVLSSVKVSATKISYRVSEAGRTKITVKRRSTGVRRHGRCVARTRHAHGHACTRLVTLGSFSHVDTAGANVITIPLRVGGHLLTAGAYELTIVSTDAAGNRSKPRAITFTIRR